ncbi:MAG TPA: DUF3455 domain-containing protein, partial [Polyangiaceae bacterium]
MNIGIRTFSLLITGLLSFSGVGCAGGAGNTGAVEESVSEATGGIHEDVCPANVPASIVPPAGNTLKMSLTGLGVQIYMCTAKADVFTWTQVGPQANLLNDEGKLIGT